MARLQIFLTFICFHIVIVSSNSLYQLFRSPSSFFKIRHRRNNAPPVRLGSGRAEARILNKEIFSQSGPRKTSWRRSDEYLEEPSPFFPSKPISFEPNFRQIGEKHSEETDFPLTHKLSNPLQFKAGKSSDSGTDLAQDDGEVSRSSWNSLDIVESLPERYTFWPENKINFVELEKSKKVYAEERISVDEETVEEEGKGIEIPAISLISSRNKSSKTVAADIKSEPIQLTPLMETPPQETDEDKGASIDNIENFFGQLSKNDKSSLNPELEEEDSESATITSLPPATSTPQSQTTTEKSLNIEHFFGQLADATSFSLLPDKEEASAVQSQNESVTPDTVTSNTENEATRINPIIIDMKNISDDDPSLGDRTEIYLGATNQNTTNAGTGIEIIADKNDELREEYRISSNKSEHQTVESSGNVTSLNLTDQDQQDPEHEIYVRTPEKPREKNDLEEKEEIISTINELTEETTTFTIVDNLQEADTNHTFIDRDTEDNNAMDINGYNADDQDNGPVSDDNLTTETPQEMTTRRLPARYVSSKTRSKPKVTTRPPKVINHNMNLQTALIINTLSKVLPNVPQSRLKNQPRLESVGLGVSFHQEELFIFHSTLTELSAILDKSLKRGGLPSDLMVSIFAAKEHCITLVHLFYKLLLEAESSPDKTLTISKEDSRIFAKHFHFLRAIFPFL